VAQSTLELSQRKKETLVTSPSGVVAVTVNGSASPAFTKPVGAVIDTVGEPELSSQLYVAGPPVFPAGSVAWTLNAWFPSVSGPNVAGLEHDEKPEPSSSHWNVEPASLAENSNVGVVSGLGSLGAESMLTLGADRSIVHVCEAGVASVLPTASVALTSKVWEPPPSPV
jgi:hypothetical protein